MRRKNLIFTTALFFLLFILHSAGIPLAHSSMEPFIEMDRSEPYTVSGRIVGLQLRDSGDFQLKVRVETIDEIPIPKPETVLTTCSFPGETPGSLFRRKICLTGTFRMPESRRNPGCFDYRLSLMSQGIFFEMRSEGGTLKEGWDSPADQAAAWLIGQRYAFRETMDPAYRGLLCGILFGDISDLDEDAYEQFQASGTAHILAVSGLHLGILYGFYRKAAGKKKRPEAAILLGILIVAYGTVSMWSPSVQRAAVMIALPVMAKFLDLRYDMLTGLSTIALFLMLRNPCIIFSTGFQMSFLAIASICFFQPVMPRRVPDSFSAMFAVQLGLGLYQMYQFNYISLAAPLANIPILFLTGLLVPSAIAGFFLFLLTGGCGPVMTLMNALSHLLLEVNRLTSLDGKASIDVISPPLWLVITLYLILFFFSSETCLLLRLRGRKKCIGAAAVGCVLFGMTAGLLTATPFPTADLVFVDVGQGDCIHIRDGKTDVLIDGGGSARYNVGKKILKPYLLKNGSRRVELAVATHLHTDHYKGLEELSAVYPVQKTVTGLIAGNCIHVSEKVFIETLWPLEISPETGQEENSRCSAFMVHYGIWRIFITGDLDAEGEQEMLQYYTEQGRADILKADILKVGHHGSSTSSCDAFLDAVDPKVAVIQVGMYNIYGHPDGKVIEKLLQKGIIIERNDQNGAVGIDFGEDRFRIMTIIS